MQLSKKITWSIALLALMTLSLPSIAADSVKNKSIYSEEEFLKSFSGKSKKVIQDKLGTPAKKEQSVKPTNASTMLAGKGQESSKPVNVEMWYYNGIVNYALKKPYKFTELTFVNDRCMNIAFFNNK
jgi:hypothetical protein